LAKRHKSAEFTQRPDDRFGECGAFAAVEAVHKIFEKSWRQVEYVDYFPVSTEADETSIVLAKLSHGPDRQPPVFFGGKTVLDTIRKNAL
jgi:hypothetical protein